MGTVGPVSESGRLYHIGFGARDLPPRTSIALLSGDPQRSADIAGQHLGDATVLSRHRGLDSYLARLPAGAPVVCATSGMGAPSLSIVVNELVQVGIRTIIRIGTCGSIQDDVHVGSVVVSSAALTFQGAANDIAPPEYPAVADPFLTVALSEAAAQLGVEAHVGITASVDTFFEGQERTATSAHPYVRRRLQGSVEEYRNLRVLNFEMEAGTLFKMGQVYGFTAGCVCGVIARRTEAEHPDLAAKDRAVSNAVAVAVAAADAWAGRE
jgi:uridine phosphorylase